MAGMRLNAIIVVLIMILCFLQYKLWFDSCGIIEMFKLKKINAKQADINLSYKKSNENLMFQVERMQKSSEATEARARNELGMIKKGEVFYQIVK